MKEHLYRTKCYKYESKVQDILEKLMREDSFIQTGKL